MKLYLLGFLGMLTSKKCISSSYDARKWCDSRPTPFPFVSTPRQCFGFSVSHYTRNRCMGLLIVYWVTTMMGIVTFMMPLFSRKTTLVTKNWAEWPHDESLSLEWPHLSEGYTTTILLAGSEDRSTGNDLWQFWDFGTSPLGLVGPQNWPRPTYISPVFVKYMFKWTTWSAKHTIFQSSVFEYPLLHD